MQLSVLVQKQESPTMYPRILYLDTSQILDNSPVVCETYFKLHFEKWRK